MDEFKNSDDLKVWLVTKGLSETMAQTASGSLWEAGFVAPGTLIGISASDLRPPLNVPISMAVSNAVKAPTASEGNWNVGIKAQLDHLLSAVKAQNDTLSRMESVSPTKFENGVVLRHFRLKYLLSMSSTLVYSAVDERDGSKVAVKMQHPYDDRQGQDASRSQLQNEHDLLSGLLAGCPGIPNVVDFGTTTFSCDSRSAQVLVLVEAPAGVRMDAAYGGNERQLLDWGMSLYKTLTEIHRRGVVHRDVKISNVVIDSYGNPVLIDFGLACRSDDQKSLGHVIGTPAYLSSQIYSGGLANASTDIDSLLLSIHAMHTGKSTWEELNHPADRVRFPSDGPASLLNRAFLAKTPKS